MPRSLDADLLLLGAGSGITPLMAILRAALAQGSGRVCLFQANRDADSVIFAGELVELQRAYPQRLVLHAWFDASQGLPDARAIATQLADWRGADCFICGPQAFMDTAHAALEELGVAKARIHLERFGAVASSKAHGGHGSHLRVELDGKRHELKVASGEVLLDAMEQAGLQPPSACRSGICAACKCRVVAGSVTMRSNQVLSEQQVRQGWTLAARPSRTAPSCRWSTKGARPGGASRCRPAPAPPRSPRCRSCACPSWPRRRAWRPRDPDRRSRPSGPAA